MTHDLSRFVAAQADSYDTALAELRAGRKRSHWIWWIFPQIAGLSRSDTARRYAISSAAEARAYLAHPMLGPRLLACTQAVATATGDAEEIMGSIDALKLRSSMTLFAAAADDPEPYRAVLDRFFAGRPDAATLRLL